MPDALSMDPTRVEAADNGPVDEVKQEGCNDVLDRRAEIQRVACYRGVARAANSKHASANERGMDKHQDEPEAGGETNPPPNVGVRPYRPTNTKDQVAP